MEQIKNTWIEFINNYNNRSFLPQWHLDKSNFYQISGVDDSYEYYVKLDSTVSSDDLTDFETNYKDIWNNRLSYRDKNGLPRSHTSPRKEGTTTYFSGAGDNGGVGEGVRLLFNMLATDPNKSRIIQFSETVYMKDGIITCVGCPIGSLMHIELFAPGDILIGSFAKTLNLLGDNILYLNTDDSEEIPSFIKMKITVKNSVTPPSTPSQEEIDKGIADHEPPKDFKVVGNMEMYRTNTK